MCNGQTTTIQAVLQGVAPWSVTWSDGTISNNILSSPATKTVLPVNPYPFPTNITYSVTALSDAHCTAYSSNLTGSATILVNPRPTAALMSFAITNCDVGTTYTLTNALTGTAPWTVIWSSNGIPIATNNNVLSSPDTLTVSPTNATATNLLIATYTISALTDNYCPAYTSNLTGSVSITVMPALSATDINDGSYSIASSSSLIITNILTGTAPWILMWSDGTNLPASASTATRKIYGTNVAVYGTNFTYYLTNITDASSSF